MQDNANVMSQSDISKINKLNNVDLAKVKGHPQIAIITVKHTDDIDDYAQDQFDKYHFGRKGLDNGVLIVLAINDHRIRIQTGYGVEGALPDIWTATSAVDGEPKQLLRQKEYGQAAYVIASRTAKRLAKEEGRIKSKKDIAFARARQKREAKEERQQMAQFAADIRHAFKLLITMALVALLLLVAYFAFKMYYSEYYLTRVVTSPIGRHYLLNKDDFTDGGPYNDLYASAMQNSSAKQNTELMASCLVLGKMFRQAKHSDYFRFISTDKLIELLKNDSLAHLIANLNQLDDHWNEFNSDYEKSRQEYFENLFDTVLKKEKAEDELSQNNYDKLFNTKDDLIQQVITQFDYLKDETLTCAILQKLRGENVDYQNTINDADKAKFTDQIEYQLKNSDVEFNLDQIRHNPKIIVELNQLGNSYTVDEGYRNMDSDDKRKFNQYLSKGQIALAVGLIVASLIELGNLRDNHVPVTSDWDDDDNDGWYHRYGSYHSDYHDHDYERHNYDGHYDSGYDDGYYDGYSRGYRHGYNDDWENNRDNDWNNDHDDDWNDNHDNDWDNHDTGWNNNNDDSWNDNDSDWDSSNDDDWNNDNDDSWNNNDDDWSNDNDDDFGGWGGDSGGGGSDSDW